MNTKSPTKQVRQDAILAGMSIGQLLQKTFVKKMLIGKVMYVNHTFFLRKLNKISHWPFNVRSSRSRLPLSPC